MLNSAQAHPGNSKVISRVVRALHRERKAVTDRMARRQQNSKPYEAVVVFNANAEPAARSRLSASGDGPTSGNPNQMRLFVDGGHVVWPDPPLNYSYAPTPMQKTRIKIPHAATQDGTLKLTCDQPPGIPGNGRTCEIVEVWLKVVAQ